MRARRVRGPPLAGRTMPLQEVRKLCHGASGLAKDADNRFGNAPGPSEDCGWLVLASGFPLHPSALIGLVRGRDDDVGGPRDVLFAVRSESVKLLSVVWPAHPFRLARSGLRFSAPE